MADPPLKLVLFAGQGHPGTLNHLGVEVGSTEDVAAAHARLAAAGLATAVEDEVTCCYAVQDKVWVDGPDSEPWEIYTVIADAETPAGQLRAVDDAEVAAGQPGAVDAGSCGPDACCDATPSVHDDALGGQAARA